MTELDELERLDPQLADYLRRGWLILPCSWHPRDKRPLVEGGLYAATRSPKLVISWWRRWPLALCAIRTGKWPEGSGIVIIDIDIRHNGFATLARLVGREIPQVPRVVSPSGGLHLYFRAPASGCSSTVGAGGKRRHGLGEGVDVKADLSMCHAPGGSPASGYHWDHPKFSLDSRPLLPLPAVLTPVEVEDDEDLTAAKPQRPIARPDAYAVAALKGAGERVRNAVPGSQRHTLNAEAYALGRLAAGLGLDHTWIIQELVEAGMQMPNQAGRPPWRVFEVRKTVREAFVDGLRKPYAPQLRSSRGRGR